CNLIYEETFDGEDALSTTVSIQNSTSYGFTIADSLAFEGSRSGRIELRYDDPIAHNGTRSEIYVIDRISHNERWYSFAVYFPTNDYEYDTSNEVISQWHKGGSPALYLRIVRDRFYIRTLHPNRSKNWRNMDLGNVTIDMWHEFVIHVIHSGKSDGLIDVWRNGVKVATHKGPNNYDNKKLPYWKVGVYKAIWNNNVTDSKKRVIFLDNIRVGNSKASFEDMATRK